MYATRQMHAMVRSEYGHPEVLSYEQIDRPVPGDDDVLVRVHAAAASIGDYLIVTGKPYLIRFTPFGGFPRPRNRVPGACMAGRVEAVGARVTTCHPGDEVYGEAVTGAFAEYVTVPANLIAPMPTNLSFEEAAAVPWAVAPLQGLRDVGGLKAGQRVLINGASGGVGTWAVQIAKVLGAHVTAVCSPRNLDRVRGLGADEVVDYTQDDFARGEARFDVVFDAVGNRSLADCRSVLTAAGSYVQCSGGDDGLVWMFGLVKMRAAAVFTRQKLKFLMTRPNRADLLILKELVEAGHLTPVIERRYPLREASAALRHVGERRSQGQTVIQVMS